MKSMHTILVTVLTAFLLVCGCSVIHPGPPPSLYTLTPAMPKTGQGPMLLQQLTVSLVNANPAIATRRIAVYPNTNEVRYFSGVSWVELAPDMIKRLQIEALESTGRFEAVSDDMAGFLPNYRLSLEVRDFSVHETQEPTVIIDLTARLINLKNGKSVGFVQVKKQSKTADSGFNAIISAFNDVTGAALQDITQWTVAQFETMNTQK